jgi:hypothetical protein
MIGIGLAIAGGLGLVGSAMGADASRSAANTQADAAKQASQTQLQMFNQTQANLQPYMQAGVTPLSQLGQQFGTANAPGNQPFGMQQFQQSPAYQFNLQQGQMAIDKAANARGNYYAPQTLQDISKFSQGVASGEFQNAFSNYNTNQNNVFSRLNQLAAGGQNAAANLGGLRAGVGESIGGNQIGAGNALAAGQIGQANALAGGLSGLGNNALLYSLLQNQGSQGLYGSGGGGMQGLNATSNDLFK